MSQTCSLDIRVCMAEFWVKLAKNKKKKKKKSEERKKKKFDFWNMLMKHESRGELPWKRGVLKQKGVKLKAVQRILQPGFSTIRVLQS